MDNLAANARDERLETLKELPPLLQQFLRKRRVGLPAVEELSEKLGVERMSLFVLRFLHELTGGYGDQPLTRAVFKEQEPYSAVDPFTEHLTILIKKGLVKEDKAGTITLAPRAVKAIEELHAAGREYVGRAQPLPPDELEKLADQLERAVEAMVMDPNLSPKPKSHFARSRWLASFVEEGAKPMVRIEQAIIDLWWARDDAHIAAWRGAGMDGLAMPILTSLWSEKAVCTTGQLLEENTHQHNAESIENAVAYLSDKGYAVRNDDEVTLTPEGMLAREDIERETDRIYFTPWPHTLEEARWVEEKMRELLEKLAVPGEGGR